MPYYLGIDTSNYTTSAALYNPDSAFLRHVKRLLPVAKGERGIRQSDALFHHTRALPELLEELFSQVEGARIEAVAASVKPRDTEGSYMPCFLAGEACARAIAASNGLGFFPFSHQAGHLAAALFSASRLDMAGQAFLAFHVSGGTTELLKVTPHPRHVFAAQLIGGTLDLNAGQVIDRIGVSMGLAFPAGKSLEELALKADGCKRLKLKGRGAYFNLSGLENMVQELLGKGETKERASRALLQSLTECLDYAAYQAQKEHGGLPLLFAGGVMSNTIIKQGLQSTRECIFAQPEFSADNAAGIAVLAAMRDGGLAP